MPAFWRFLANAACFAQEKRDAPATIGTAQTGGSRIDRWRPYVSAASVATVLQLPPLSYNLLVYTAENEQGKRPHMLRRSSWWQLMPTPWFTRRGKLKFSEISMRLPTPFTRFSFDTALRWACTAAALSAPLAYADDYSEVSRLMRAGQLPDAMAKAEQYLANKPRDPQMRFIKGVVQTEAGKANDAIATFTQITQDYPELPEPYNNLAVLYAGQSQFDKARAALEMAIRTNPSYATAHENLGDVYARLASQAYGKALQLDSSNSAVQPKLILIRNLFMVDSKVASKPAVLPPVAAVATAATTATTAPKPATIAPMPAPAAIVAATKPAPAAPLAEPALTPAVPGEIKEVEAAVRAWAQAWSAKDMSAYLGSYANNFDPPGKQARKAWESDRRARIVGKSIITVNLSNLSVTVQGNRSTAKFKQDYSADTLNISSRKTLDLTKVGERWVIVRESTGG